MSCALNVSGAACDDATQHLVVALGAHEGRIGAVTLAVAVGEQSQHVHAKARARADNDAVRAHVVAASVHEAVERVASRLRSHVDVVVSGAHPQPARGHRGVWEFGDTRPHQPPFASRRPSEREIVRRKRYELARLTPEAAIRAATLLDYDFYVFVDARSRRTTAVRRNDRRWQLVDATRCRVRDAVELLDVSNARFLCFDDGAGWHALYRRHDGNYGLLSPPDVG